MLADTAGLLLKDEADRRPKSGNPDKGSVEHREIEPDRAATPHNLLSHVKPHHLFTAPPVLPQALVFLKQVTDRKT